MVPAMDMFMKSSPASSQTSEIEDRGRNVEGGGEAREEKKGREHRLLTSLYKECEEAGQRVVLCSLEAKIFGRSAEGPPATYGVLKFRVRQVFNEKRGFWCCSNALEI